MTTRAEYWTNPSARALLRDKEGDPIQVITEKAMTLALAAMEEGWTGPPFDPFILAQYLRLRVTAREDIADARTVPTGSQLTIEFNPNRPKARIRYSIYHEIAHTLFPDCRERVRNRLTHATMKGDDWQLEMLCNLAAAEFAMPTGSLPPNIEEHLDIESVLALRKRYEVSAEAMLLRLVKLTNYQCSFFAASRLTTPEAAPRYAIDFLKPSRNWQGAIPRPRAELPSESVVSQCTAIGFTAHGQEEWHQLGKVKVECVGISPYPNQLFPRVVGIIRPHRQSGHTLPTLDDVRGDATQPRGTGHRFLVQIINDKAVTWGGGGFSSVVRKKWPRVHDDFHAWAMDRANLKLGHIHVAPAEKDITVISMIAQHGYGPSPRPRIRYVALWKCLTAVGEMAAKQQATVHMPRIGSGQAGASWDVVGELVVDAICSRGIKVLVYTLPGAEPPTPQQGTLRFLAPGFLAERE